MVCTALAGYVMPSLLGAGAAVLLAAHHVIMLLWLFLVLLGATFVLIRNAYGVLAVLLTLGAVCVVTLLAPAPVQAAFGYGAAWFLLLGGVRPVVELFRSRRRARRRGRPPWSDADQLARLTGVPGGVWVAVFGLVAVVALAAGARLLIPGSLHVLGLR